MTHRAVTGRAGLRAFGVVDLGFGDAGKGLLTDYLTRRTRASVVVRFSGGAQAGHNVVTPDGRHHVFSQFGAGSFVPGVRTFLTRDVVVHPTALLREATVLDEAGVASVLDGTAISERALIVTPFHQALNRLRELARGPRRHGSCGVGVGETVRDAQANPADAIRAGDLRDDRALAIKLARARGRLREELRGLATPPSDVAAREATVFEFDDVADRWLEQVREIASCVVPDARLAQWLSDSPAVVFEGSQGLLLDETLGFHPHTTWSSCTADAARRALAEAAPDARLSVWGVLRAHAVRHGPGPLPTEDDAIRAHVVDHNATNEWQGRVRYGWFDAALARYALALTRNLDALVVTHMDAVGRNGPTMIGNGYVVPTCADGDLMVGLRGGAGADLVADPTPTLARQERLGTLLRSCRPMLEPVAPGEANWIARAESVLGRPLDIVSRGPTALDVELRARRLLDSD